ncbi:PepSY-associated TM helix domain-containing protein [Pseudonocardia eucalypti]|uniref:PepSY-associated TM helix domain-containing protein n=1 Tax=Pseudonocardia eucalypti TaxID=648755 RepID=A0ABP9QSZ3_9PSEU|nr:putative iron-regulated membrane protein [Pseudonocardia eucalypti]
MSDTTLPPPTLEQKPETTRATGLRRWWRLELQPLLRRVHFRAGLLVAPFLFVAAFTGLLYTLTPQLEPLVHREQLRVTVPPGGAPLPLSQQVASALPQIPGGRISEIRPAAAPDGSTRVTFAAPDLPDTWTRTVFVDPYTARPLGTLVTYGEWLPVRAWFDELHRTLMLGEVGRVYSELAASWLWVLTLSGLGIWLLRRRRDRKLRRVIAPDFGASGRVRLRSWHGSVGVWVALVLLFLSATGLTWSKFAGTNVDTLRTELSWTTPSVHTTLATPAAPTPPDVPATAERVLGVARAHGLTDPVEITPPSKPGKAWVVQQNQRSWPSKQDSLAIDPATGTVVDQLRFADWPLAAKLARWGIDAHMGILFGLANQIALALVAVGQLSMIVWGFRMWWRRRPANTDPPASMSALVTVGAAAVLIGFFLPVFGASLLLFLLVDALRGRREWATAPS